MPEFPTILGLVGIVGLTFFQIPQMWASYRAPVLTGFDIRAWVALWVAIVALGLQAALLGLWTAAAANVVGVFSVAYIITQIYRKGRI
jgi:hypothetical protein